MKRITPYIALLALVVMVGCSADSPRAKPAPTVVPQTWNITSLTVSDSSTFVGVPVLVEAQVTVNGAPPADGTTVKFSSSGPGEVYGFTQGTLMKSGVVLSRDASVVTEDGYAAAFFLVEAKDESDNPSGRYTLQAQVGDAVRQEFVSYVGQATTDALQLYSVNPNRGPYFGGQEVTILGKGIAGPVDVFFDLEGVAYPAQIIEVEDSNPNPTDTGSITVVTPVFAGANNLIEQAADVRVITYGSGGPQGDTLAGAYRLLPGSAIAVFGVVPNSGRASGGEIVNVLGEGFGSNASQLTVSFTFPADDPANPEDFDQVRFGRVLAVSPDGTQIQAETPLFFGFPPPESDVVFDVSVSAPNGSATAFDSFVVITENPTPIIASISPTAGPLDGGTQVTIFGSGFQAPMQVYFGNRTALDVNIFNDTSPADEDRITCVTPDYSQEGEVPPVVVDVQVWNLTSGNNFTLSGAYRYGDPLYITGNTPTEGGLGDLVIIYGSGFEDPLQVFLGGELMEVISVSGTVLVVKIPDDLATECAGTSGSFTVTLLESGLQADGGNFNIVGNSPTVLSVNPIILQEDVFGDLDPDDITITGQAFADEVLVRVGTYIMPSSQVTVNGETSIDVDNLPDVGTLGITFVDTPCTLPGGEPGTQSSATPLSVTVTNFPGNCPDTLNGAIVLEPFDSACTATPATLAFTGAGVSGSSVSFGNDVVDGGATCVNRVITATNFGGTVATDVGGASGGDFTIVGGTCDGVIDLAYLSSCTISIDFCASALGAQSDSLSVAYGGGLLPSQDLALTGTGIAP